MSTIDLHVQAQVVETPSRKFINSANALLARLQGSVNWDMEPIDDNTVYLKNFRVSDDYRSMGVGSEVVSRLTNLSDISGSIVRLYANMDTVNWWQNLGFMIISGGAISVLEYQP